MSLHNVNAEMTDAMSTMLRIPIFLTSAANAAAATRQRFPLNKRDTGIDGCYMIKTRGYSEG